MLASMTGFIAHTFDIVIGTEKVPVTLHIKSLNARFFESTCRLPHALAHLEPAIIKKMRDQLHRGTVYCSIYLGSPLVLTSTARPSWGTIETYVKAAEDIAASYGSKIPMKTELDINTILMLPHAIEFIESPLDAATSDVIMQELDKQLQKLVAERIVEGHELEIDLEKRLQKIESLTVQIKERSREVFELRRHKLMQEMEKITEASSPEARETQLQAIHAQLEKLDITEEIVRLAAHRESASQTMKAEGIEKGKKLDFILQEMFREINTIGAKCADSALVSFAIAVKVELEKAREQVQNIV